MIAFMDSIEIGFGYIGKSRLSLRYSGLSTIHFKTFWYSESYEIQKFSNLESEISG